MKSRWMLVAAMSLAAVISLTGCDGDDGDPGPQGETGEQGPAGPAGPPGQDASVSPVESCVVCHGAGAFADASANHELPPVETYSGVTFTVNGADLDVTFDLKADGAPATGYDRIERGYKNPGNTEIDICNAPSRNDPCDPASLALTDNGAGNYTIKVLGGAADAATNHRYVFRVAAGSDRETRVYLYGDTPASPFAPAVVSAEACTNCHGPEGIGIHGGYYAAQDGAEPCLVCHGSDDVPPLFEVAHGFHAGLFEEVTYPTYLTNCSVCHDTDATLAAANSMSVSGENCFSCHGSMAYWDFPTALSFHESYDETTNCAQCHTTPGGIAFADVTGAHNGLVTERGGIIWDGEDTSIVEGDRFTWEITGVSDDGTDVTITWVATFDGTAVDPCNATVGATAPVFHGDGSGNLSMLRNYAQGGDFILGQDTRSPGQAAAVNVTTDNTTCASNVATTVIPADTVDATVGRVALQGKPRVVSVADATATMAVRVPTPTYDWVLGTDDMAVERRPIVDTTQCLKCHVGSLYQHGGNRVDNVDMCILCHNSASNEKNVRVGMGVDASEAYDGKVGQTFEMKSMLHSIHSAGATGAPIVIYRNRGIYAWAGSEDQLPNWPGTGDQIVYGSDNVTQPHNFHTPTYPRGTYDCAACHSADFERIFPDATKAMATTVDAGGTDYGNQIDDVLQGATAASCMTCHRSSDSTTEAGLKAHAYQNGWVPQTFEEGRKTIIEAND